MRSDFTLDNVKTPLPKASALGFNRLHAKRGNWVGFHLDPHWTIFAVGRVIGRVLCAGLPGQAQLMVCSFGSQFDSVSVRWVLPEAVSWCVETTPFAFEGSAVAACDFNDLREVRKLMTPHLSIPLHFGTNNPGV